MDEVIVISICEKLVNTKQMIGYEFHFKGYFKGSKINKINVETTCQLLIGEEYLLLLEIIEVRGGGLRTQLVKSKELNKINYP